MQFDVVARVAVAIVAHPPLFWSAVCFSYIQQQWKRIINDKVETSAIAPIRFLTKREVVQLQGKGVYVVGVTGIGCELE